MTAALAAALLLGCRSVDAPATPIPTVTNGSGTAAPATPVATEMPAGTAPAVDTRAPTDASEDWPAPAFGIPPVDAAIGGLRAGDGDALLDLVAPATAECTTAQGAGGPPKCPDGVADGTTIEYFPYFECDGWGHAEGARERLTGGGAYALAVLAYDPPVAARATDEAVIRHAIVLARGGFGDGADDDARLLTTLVFDEDSIREINGDCGAYSQDAFAAGELPAFDEAEVLWRRYPGPDGG